MANSKHKQLDAINLSHGTRVLGDEKTAKDLLAMFIQKLPIYQDEIHGHVAKQRFLELKEAIHALKGATCYTSTPVLHAMVGEIDAFLSSNQFAVAPWETEKQQLAKLIAAMDHHIDDLQAHYEILIKS
jgi:HPt (histidine-containing phosphotransfer) domain-containing protein